MRGQDSAEDRDEAAGKKPKDERHHPIEQSNTSTDPSGDPAPLGSPPPPPYEGPPGGGSHGSHGKK